MERPFTPDTLAEHWGCSPQHVRDLCRAGKLRHFKLGDRLIRIQPVAVLEYEAQQCESVSANIAENGRSSGEREARRVVGLSVRQIGKSLKPSTERTSIDKPSSDQPA